MKDDLKPALQCVSLFDEFSDDELFAMLDLLDPVEVKAGNCIVRQDEPGECMFVLLQGKAKVIHRAQGKRIELAELDAGDFFGELALVDEGPRSADVEAVEDCLMLSLSQGVLRSLAGVYPSAAFKLMLAVGRRMVQRLRTNNRKYIDSLLAASEHISE